MSVSLLDSLGSAEVELNSYFDAMVSGLEVTASLVADKFGFTVSNVGNSKGLGNPTDLQLLLALRRKSGVVLTSGRTFLAEAYRMPSQADLAIMSRSSPDVSHLGPRVDQKVHWLGEDGNVSSYGEAVQKLHLMGYSSIHSEFGLAGVKALIANQFLDALFVSSKSSSGVIALLEVLGLRASAMLEIGGLSVAIVAWQRDARPLAS